MTYSLAGPGTGTLVETADGNPSIVLTATTGATSVSITTRGGAGGVTFAGISADSAVGSIFAPTTSLSGVFSISGPIQKLVMKSLDGSNLAAASFGSVLIEGAVNASKILARTSFGADGAPGGGDDTFAAATIRSLRVVGSVTSSIFAAGLNPVDGIYLNGNDTLIPGGQIVAVSVGGILSADSRVLAATLPRIARVGRLIVTIATDSRFAF